LPLVHAIALWMGFHHRRKPIIEGTSETQRSWLLLLSIDWKDFTWQRHHMQNIKNKGKSW